MRESFRLGRVAGVRVDVQFNVVFMIGIIASGPAFGRFRLLQPGRGTATYVLPGVVAAIAFLASPLAHEMRHAVVTRRNGVEVEAITLWLLGGVAQLKGRSPSPGADFRIAGVGPLTTLALSGAFAALAGLTRLTGMDGLPLAGARLPVGHQPAAGGLRPAACSAAGRRPAAACLPVAATRRRAISSHLGGQGGSGLRRGVVSAGGRVTGVLPPADVARTLHLHELGALGTSPSGAREAEVLDPVSRT